MSSGEAITLAGIGEDLERAGSTVTFLATKGASRFLEPRFGGRVQAFGDSLCANQRLWNATLARDRPLAIVFADYPLLFFSSGSVPLADDGWVESLERCGCALFTLDHLGYAQGERIVAFGPPHMTFGMEVTRALPARMQVLLPCPINDPARSGLRGMPYRSAPVSEVSDPQRREVRVRLLDDERALLVLHSTPGWAVHLARGLGLPHHAFLGELLAEIFADCARAVVVASVGSDRLLNESRRGRFRTVNLLPMPPADFERLIAAADLVLTDNAISVSLGKAVCLRRCCAVLANSSGIAELDALGDAAGARWARAIERERPGAIFPWEVFPIWNGDDLERLGFGEDHAFRRCAARLELFGGEATGAQIAELVDGGPLRARIDVAQREYLQLLRALPSASVALAKALA
jgi:hypothetical protein